MTDNKHIVAMDLGSNSFHLIIAKEHQGQLIILDKYKQRVSLATGLNNDNVLDSGAIARGIHCLKQFGQRFSRLPHDSVKIVATQSLRKAVNRQDFIDAAYKVLPYKIEIIDGKTEASLIYQGVAQTHTLKPKTLVIDIGGGSTEFIIGNQVEAVLKDSLELGSGQLSKRYFNPEAITKESFAQAYDVALTQVSSIAQRYKKYSWQLALGTSGSIKLIQQVLKQLYGSNKITKQRLKQLRKQLINCGKLTHVPINNIPEEKLTILPGAVTILLACFEQLNLDELSHCQAALREGVLYSLSHSYIDSDTRQQTISSMLLRYPTDADYNRRVIKQLNHITQQLPLQGISLTTEELDCLTTAIQLHEVGLSINAKKRQHHSAYIIKHSEMLGFSSTQKQLIHDLVKSHRRNITLPAENKTELGKHQLLLLVLMRLAILCAQGRINLPVIPCKVSFQLSSVHARFQQTSAPQDALIAALSKEKEYLQAIGIEFSYSVA
ncbi:Ppx/GppA phosphatase family protein [Psychrobium sp. 1_MG-2023]|uniref:Ppx/GppA phosphatase family protein n=1 Tax=Psychrobium sp. 1_MG-2023 TaxID=3062624 RepID=UPI000C31E8EB|nr:Ppx/GppA phosphatase family protein [Psychrobium sp. 1_MG-2023]MDP2561343.1 Ppx/GppA phosphatase family protein [Psychrobium sp. 1_MG-2023]PKF54156.1 hypothetical protein CW748_17010 [Alteromonadales bacterium alter-6D02]